jgi:hypothetical protein
MKKFSTLKLLLKPPRTHRAHVSSGPQYTLGTAGYAI